MKNVNLILVCNELGETMVSSFAELGNENVKKKIIRPESYNLQKPFYKKVATSQAMVEWLNKGKKKADLESAITKENMRVNSLKALLEELKAISNFINGIEEPFMLRMYLPTALINEVKNGTWKYYIANNGYSTKYYSDEELTLWSELAPILNSLYPVTIIRNEKGIPDKTDTPEDKDRNTVHNRMTKVVEKSFEEQDKIANPQKYASGPNRYRDAFNNWKNGRGNNNKGGGYYESAF